MEEWDVLKLQKSDFLMDLDVFYAIKPQMQEFRLH